MRIDVHAHYFPDEYLDATSRMDPHAADVRARTGPQVPFDQRIEMMDRTGIDMQVLSIATQAPYFDNKANAVAAAQMVNDIYVDLGRRYPGRFAGFASVPLPHADEAIKEVARALDSLGMLGVTLGCSVNGRHRLERLRRSAQQGRGGRLYGPGSAAD